MNTRVILPIGLAVVGLLGAGCQKSTARQATNPKPYESNAWLPPATSTDTTPKPIDELRAALTAFQDSKSFHTEMYVTSNNAKVLAKLDVMKPDRFRGTFEQVAGVNPIDVIGIGSSLYARSKNGSWTMVSGDQVASVTSFAQTAQSAGRFLVEKAIPEGSNVTRTEDVVNHCTKLETTINPGTDAESKLSLCVADEKPISINVTSKNTTYAATYSDYNDLFAIEKPSVKK